MVIKRIFGRRWVRCLGLVGIAAGGYVAGLTINPLKAQQTGAAPAPASDKRVVAYIYGNLPVTREELGDFLINRGGHEKLELLVNRRIIEVEAARYNISVTAQEVQAALNENIESMNITMKDFTDRVLPRYHKTLYEWMEDVVKPRLLLGKMCHVRIKITDDDIKRSFENEYGEQRQPKIIIWKKEDGGERRAIKDWDEARKGDAEFDAIAKSQFTPALASGGGLIAPLGKYPDVEDDTCTKELYKLKNVGDITGLLETPAGIMCMKLHAIIPPRPPICKITDQSLAAMKAANLPEAVLTKLLKMKDKEFSRLDAEKELANVLTKEEVQQTKDFIVFHTADMAISYAKMRPAIEHKAYDKKLSAEIPKFFTELKARAQPNLLLKGPPTTNELIEAARQEIQEIQQTGGIQPGSTPPRKP
jgi:hypothetical protein